MVLEMNAEYPFMNNSANYFQNFEDVEQLPVASNSTLDNFAKSPGRRG
jgi:hypothetical protein